MAGVRDREQFMVAPALVRGDGWRGLASARADRDGGRASERVKLGVWSTVGSISTCEV